MATFTNGNINNVISIKPNVRYGNTFLSSKYRDYAVNGEVMIDKSSGEIFIKRPSDGKVVSFDQNKKYMNDLILSLRILLNNNTNFTYPKTTDDAYFMSTNYDLVSINNESLINIIDGDDSIVDNNSDYEVNKLEFPISIACNGFFIRAMSRDCDKPVVEYITNQYNKIFENYDGPNITAVKEHRRFDELRWKDSNAILHYNVIVKYGLTAQTYECTENIRLNEDIFVNIPITTISNDFPSGYEKIKIQVNKIEYYKIHFMFDHQNEISDYVDEDTETYYITGLNKFLYADGRIDVNVVNVMSFIDDTFDVKLFNNESIVAMIDMPYVVRYMNKMAQLKDKANTIVSVERPDDAEWGANTMWIERIMDFDDTGTSTLTGSDTDFKMLESYLANYGTYTTTIGIGSEATSNEMKLTNE